MKTTSFHVGSIVFTRYKTYVKTVRRKKYTQVNTTELIKKLHFSDPDKNFFKKYKAENSCKELFTHEKMKIEFQDFFLLNSLVPFLSTNPRIKPQSFNFQNISE